MLPMIVQNDLTVVGAGISGICAAVAAARHGIKVSLINDRSVPGGKASSEIGITILGASHHGLNPSIYAKEGGIIEEIRMMFLKYNEFGGYGNAALCDAVFMDLIYHEPNITLYLNTTITNTIVVDKKITQINAFQSKTGNEYVFISPTYVDSSGDGVVAFQAGCEYKMGRDGKDEFGEKWAPTTKESYTMGHTIYYENVNVGKPVKYTRPNFAYDISEMEFTKNINKPENFRGFSVDGANWTFEYGGQLNTINDNEKIILELRRLIFGIWDYVKNSGKYPESENYALKRVYTMPGTRESRRIVGDYILTENDIEQNIIFEDSVAIGGWPMDVHAPLGIYDTAPASNFISVSGLYNIPLRSLYAKDLTNLFLAGRNISATQIALGSTRVMATCGCIGQAVGTAAIICKNHHVSTQDVVTKYINELQQILLNDDQSIIGFRNDTVMNNFKISANSQLAFENVKSDELLPLCRDYGIAFALTTDMIDSVYVKFKNDTNKNKKVKVKIYTGSRINSFIPDELIKSFDISISAEFDNWFWLDINAKRGVDGKIYIVFEKCDGVSLYVSKKPVDGAVTHRYHTYDNHEGRNHDSCPLDEKTGYTHIDNNNEKNRNILFKDVIPTQTTYSVQNLLNGYSRPTNAMNMWKSADNKPQKIILEDLQCDINEIQLVFDTDLSNEFLEEIPPVLTKKYKISIYHKDGVDVFEDNDNFKRFVRFKVGLKGVNKIVVDLNESYGDHFSLYAINII